MYLVISYNQLCCIWLFHITNKKIYCRIPLTYLDNQVYIRCQYNFAILKLIDFYTIHKLTKHMQIDLFYICEQHLSTSVTVSIFCEYYQENVFMHVCKCVCLGYKTIWQYNDVKHPEHNCKELPLNRLMQSTNKSDKRYCWTSYGNHGNGKANRQ